MTHLSVRHIRGQALQHAPYYFDPRFLDEGGVGDMWKRCIDALDRSNAHRQTAGVLKVGAYHAQIHVLYNERGRLVRFWLRTVIGNHLLIVGNRDGLLPLDVEALHGC